jgi:hypothetical protein
MAISPLRSPFLDRRTGVQATPSAAHRLDTVSLPDWNQVMLDQEKIQARASLRPEMAASIRAAQNIWLAAQNTQPALIPASDAETDIEAFITMLVEQASNAKR